jgi:16S rRNA (cytosine967-C5)-methyltransferase
MSAARVAAARVLADVLGGRALDQAWPRADAGMADPRDRALARAIVLAALRGYWRYRAVLALLLDRDGRVDRLVEALLLCALAQLDQAITPPFAVVADSVSAARTLGRPRLAGLVNAVLRRYQREAAELTARLPDDIEIRHDHPRWLIERIKAQWPDAWQDVLAANLAPTLPTLRINRRRASRADVAATLAQAGITTTADPNLPDALALTAPADIAHAPGLAQGHWSIQDGAAQLAVELLDLAPGLRVLDACAAPGGKSAHIAEREPELADLHAVEADAARARRIGETLGRLGLADAARVFVADATRVADWWDGRSYDRILLDAPCSGTGVIRRHPDIRLHRRASDLGKMTALQDRLLDALWPMLAPGGRLVYATCSVLAEENADRVAAFLARQPRARALAAVPTWFGRASGDGRQNLPGEGGRDGFYYAVLAHR